MTLLKCPHRDADLPVEGADDEWCEACGKRLPVHVVAAVHAEAKRRRTNLQPIELPEVEDKPLSPTTQSRLRLAARVASCLLCLVGIGSFFSPWGWLPAFWLGHQRGGTLCARPGCLRPAEVKVNFYQVDDFWLNGHKEAEFVGEHPIATIGFCREHAPQPDERVRLTRHGGITDAFGAVMIFSPIVFAALQVFWVVRVFQNREGALWQLALITLVGIFLVNALARQFWIYGTWMYSFG
jgi:hypothetical protein